jgi:hypothetical protein
MVESPKGIQTLLQILYLLFISDSDAFMPEKVGYCIDHDFSSFR